MTIEKESPTRSGRLSAGGGTKNRPAGRLRRILQRRNRGVFIFLGLTPVVILVMVFIYYPLANGVVMAFQDVTLRNFENRDFVGLKNFQELLQDPQFLQACLNTVYWVVGSIIPQVTLGLGIALLLKRRFPGRGIYQATIFFPWAVAGFLIALMFRWMLDGQFGVVNDLLLRSGIIDSPIAFLSSPAWAMPSVIFANVWYGTTFFAIMLLAALQSVPKDLEEAASIDGAGRFRRFQAVTLPHILPTLLTSVLLRVIWITNFPDIIWVMTRGGPAGSTHIITTYLIEQIFVGQNYSKGAAIGLIVFAGLITFLVFYTVATKVTTREEN
ncbi:sugar ABC transporter permease [Rhodoglobus aureus]|uniref:Sugar ABC transporter permease n=1 Tax=Rhodoglobus aureus TaxID=191497 RepID=A0ABP4G2Y6_9MICO